MSEPISVKIDKATLKFISEWYTVLDNLNGTNEDLLKRFGNKLSKLERYRPGFDTLKIQYNLNKISKYQLIDTKYGKSMVSFKICCKDVLNNNHEYWNSMNMNNVNSNSVFGMIPKNIQFRILTYLTGFCEIRTRSIYESLNSSLNSIHKVKSKEITKELSQVLFIERYSQILFENLYDARQQESFQHSLTQSMTPNLENFREYLKNMAIQRSKKRESNKADNNQLYKPNF